MKNYFYIFLFIGLFFLYIYTAQALPAPCSGEKLIETSDFALEGFIIDTKCSEPRETKDCPANKNTAETVADCTASIKVTKWLKGGGQENETTINYQKLIIGCEESNYEEIYKNFEPNAKIEYYHSSCQNNFRILAGPIINLSINK
jgi:hypothetical protein